MPNYQNGKIYKITSGELTYIGSTCEPTLARRLSGHVRSYKQWKDGKHGHMTSYPLIETGQYEITLIELWPRTSKDELTARERFHIESNVCVNKCIPSRTHKEWYDANTNNIRERMKAYREANGDKIREYRKTLYEANKDNIREQQKAYYAANIDTIRERHKANYAKKSESV